MTAEATEMAQTHDEISWINAKTTLTKIKNVLTAYGTIFFSLTIYEKLQFPPLRLRRRRLLTFYDY